MRSHEGNIQLIQSFKSGILVILSVDQADNSPGFSADFIHMPRPSEVFSDPNPQIFEGIHPFKNISTNQYWSQWNYGLLLPGYYHIFAFCCIEI